MLSSRSVPPARYSVLASRLLAQRQLQLDPRESPHHTSTCCSTSAEVGADLGAKCHAARPPASAGMLNELISTGTHQPCQPGDRSAKDASEQRRYMAAAAVKAQPPRLHLSAAWSP